MSLNKLKEFFCNRPKPIIILHLDSNSSKKSNPTDLEHTFNLQDDRSIPLNQFESDYRRLYLDIRTLGLQKVKSAYEQQQHVVYRCRKAMKNWLNQVEITEDSTKGTLWVLRNDEPTCISGSEAEKDDMHILPRFLTNPDRFQKEFIPASRMQEFRLQHSYRKVSDCLQEHLEYKSTQIWSIADISTFLKSFFRMPKKFEDIQKYLPEKSLKEIIQLFYVLKYPFKLKKYLRIQARRKREELTKEHAKKIICALRKKFPGQEFITQNDLTGLVSNEKCMAVERYYEKYGKDSSKLQHAFKDFQDYSRYKESAFGGEKISDEGPFSQEESLRRGTSQWTYEEKMLFVKLYKQFGRNWNDISFQILTKSPSQVRNFYQNYKKKLKLDSISVEQDEQTILAAAGITNKIK